MIYFKFNESAREASPDLPEYGFIDGIDISDADIKFRFMSESIFRFVYSTTQYYKNRSGIDYQYSDEEKVVIALKAVLL